MRRIVGPAVVLLALVSSACSGGVETFAPEQSQAAADAPTTTTTEARVPSPLTGKPVTAAAATRPAISIKVDNSREGRPQAGLELADVVIEERVEGGVTRFIAVFQSEEADLVGPIRSLRTTDSAIVSALGGVFTFSDGVAVSLRRLKGTPVTVVSEREGAGPFTYPADRRRPYKTFAATARLRREAPRNANAPPRLFDFLAAGEKFAPAAAIANHATITYGSRTTAGFDWEPSTGTWLRSSDGAPHLVKGGDRLAFTTVVVQSVPYRSAGYKDSSGFRVDEAIVVGGGDAIVLAEGRQVKARWTKASPTAVTTFTDIAGAPLRIPQGRVLVALPPVGAPLTVS